jgi:hypothetical protein
MNWSKSLPAVVAAACLVGAAGEATAQPRGRAGHGGGGVGHAVPRVYAPAGRVYGGRVYGGPVYGRRVIIAPRILAYAPYRPYYYPFRRGLTIGFFGGYGYPYGYPYYGGYYPYGYSSYYGYGYGYGGYGGYGYGPYGYSLPPPSYVSMRPGVAYGGVRIQGAPRDAQVFADGYYVGIVDDFDGAFQHLNLEAGTHQIEVRMPGQPPIAFDVNVQPGQTITYHAGITR